MYIPLTNEQKAELDIPLENEIYVIREESSDYCGINENFAFSLPRLEDAETAIDHLECNHYSIMDEHLREYYSEDDLEDVEYEPSLFYKVEDASDWEFNWIPNSCVRMNF